MCGGSKTGPEVEDEASGMDDISTNDRKCTDCLWVFLFAAFWVGMVVVAIIGFTMGKPNKLIYAVSVLHCCVRSLRAVGGAEFWVWERGAGGRAAPVTSPRSTGQKTHLKTHLKKIAYAKPIFPASRIHPFLSPYLHVQAPLV